MAASEEQIARLRRMVAEPSADTYTDDGLQEYIERFSLVDARGQAPLVKSLSSSGGLEANPDWTPTYDLNAAAAEIWLEKAGILAQDYDFTADGGSHHRSQAYEQAMKQARFYNSRRSPKTITLRPEPLAPGSQEMD